MEKRLAGYKMHQQCWEERGGCDYKGFSKINLCADEILLYLD